MHKQRMTENDDAGHLQQLAKMTSRPGRRAYPNLTYPLQDGCAGSLSPPLDPSRIDLTGFRDAIRFELLR